MIRLFGKDLTTGQLAIRILIGSFLAAGIVLIFYVIPFHFDWILLPVLVALGLPPALTAQGSAYVMNSFILPNLPALLPVVAIALAVAVFCNALFRDTDIHGPVLIIDSVLWIALILVILEGGNMDIVLSVELPISGLVLSGITLRAGFVLMMLIVMLPYIIGAAKGAVITLRTRANKLAPKPP